ncbi:hypothetical protein M8J76_009094 [Diaphorina citri]|nr:hypothetical protein M8J76_009094 [Diaphorina citri]KAI5716591.1 hypothetical protein M8J76_009094 [Diaphorina citri]
MEDTPKGDNLQSLSASRNQYHYQIPSLNLHQKIKDKNVIEMLNSFQPLRPAQSYPIPFTSSNDIANKVLNGIETCSTLVVEKTLHLKARNIVVQNANKAYKKSVICKIKIDEMEAKLDTAKEGPMELPKELYQVAAFIERDPDPHFTGDENWYYSNCILVKNILGAPCLLSARGKYNNDLVVMPLYFNEKSERWSTREELTHHCRLNSLQPVLQLVATKGGIIGVRKKSSISVLKMARDENGTLSTTLINTIESFVHPYTSIDIHKHYLLVTNTARELEAYSVKKRTPKLEGTVRSHSDCTYCNKWNSVAYWKGSDMALFVDVCGISVVDLKSANLNLVSFWCFRAFLENCERLCVVTPSQISPDLVYIGTTHRVFGLNTEKMDAKAVLFRVTHHMSAVPLYCAVRSVDDTQETLVLGDQALNQMRSLVIKFDARERPSCPAYVTYVNTPLDTLHQARLRGELLNGALSKRGELLNGALAKRFDNNLMGLSFLPPAPATGSNDDHAHRRLTLFSLRSSGDIFHQDMSQDLLRPSRNKISLSDNRSKISPGDNQSKISPDNQSNISPSENQSKISPDNQSNISPSDNQSKISSDDKQKSEESRISEKALDTALPFFTSQIYSNSGQLSPILFQSQDLLESSGPIVPSFPESDTISVELSRRPHDQTRSSEPILSSVEGRVNSESIVCGETVKSQSMLADNARSHSDEARGSDHHREEGIGFDESQSMLTDDARSQSDQTRSSTKSGSHPNRSMNDEELEMLRKWRKDFDQRELTRNKPMYGGRNRMFRDIFSEDPPPSHPSQDTSSLTTSLSDLSLNSDESNMALAMSLQEEKENNTNDPNLQESSSPKSRRTKTPRKTPLKKLKTSPGTSGETPTAKRATKARKTPRKKRRESQGQD